MPCSYFTGEKTQAWRSHMACSQGYGTFVVELGVKARTPNSQLGAYVTQNMKQ